MAEANDKYGIIYQNLVDAGCNQKTIQCCMKLAQENNVEALLSQLCMYRKHLMEQTHNYQENIDCLDYLIYSLKKSNEQIQRPSVTYTATSRPQSFIFRITGCIRHAPPVSLMACHLTLP